MTEALKDFEIRKSLHISMTKDTHAALRICLFERQLSMQEVFENLAIKIIEEDPYMQRFLTTCQELKRKKQLSNFTATDAESIYEVIAHSDPILVNNEG